MRDNETVMARPAEFHVYQRNILMRLLFAALCCAASALPAQTSRARVFLPGFQQPIPIEDSATPFELNVSKGRAYAAIKAAFVDLNVPLDVDDVPGGILGNKSIKALASFGGLQLSRIVDCGSSQRGQNADTFRVSLVLFALLDSVDATHTKVQVAFVGGAVPVGASVQQGVQCGSTGVMEEKLIGLAKTRL
jgi:hypothetical protein